MPPKVNDGGDQPEEAAEIARIVDVGDAHKTRQVRDLKPGGEILPPGIISAVPGPKKVTEDGCGQGGGNDDGIAPKTVTKCGSTWKRRDGKPGDEPGGDKANPPGSQEPVPQGR